MDMERAAPARVLVLSCWPESRYGSIKAARQIASHWGGFMFHWREANQGFLRALSSWTFPLPPWLAPRWLWTLSEDLWPYGRPQVLPPSDPFAC